LNRANAELGKNGKAASSRIKVILCARSLPTSLIYERISVIKYVTLSWGRVAEHLGSPTYDQLVMGLTPGQVAIK